MLIGAQQWSLTDLLNTRWHLSFYFVTWIISLLQPAFKSMKQEKEKGAEFLLDTSSSPITLTSHCSDCHSIPKAYAMLLYLCSVHLSKTKKQKTKQELNKLLETVSLIPVLPIDIGSHHHYVLHAVSVHRQRLHQPDISRPGNGFPIEYVT